MVLVASCRSAILSATWENRHVSGSFCLPPTYFTRYVRYLGPTTYWRIHDLAGSSKGGSARMNAQLAEPDTIFEKPHQLTIRRVKVHYYLRTSSTITNDFA